MCLQENIYNTQGKTRELKEKQINLLSQLEKRTDPDGKKSQAKAELSVTFGLLDWMTS